MIIFHVIDRNCKLNCFFDWFKRQKMNFDLVKGILGLLQSMNYTSTNNSGQNSLNREISDIFGLFGQRPSPQPVLQAPTPSQSTRHLSKLARPSSQPARPPASQLGLPASQPGLPAIQPGLQLHSQASEPAILVGRMR